MTGSGWVYLDDFLQGITALVGRAEPVTLKQKGKRWRYALPSYTDEEKALIECVIFDRLFEVGITDVGLYKGRKFFCVTPFGRMAIGE